MHQHNHEYKCISLRSRRRGRTSATSKTRQRETTQTLAPTSLHIDKHCTLSLVQLTQNNGEIHTLVQVCTAHSGGFTNRDLSLLGCGVADDKKQSSLNRVCTIFRHHHMSIRQLHNDRKIPRSFSHHEQAGAVTIFKNMPANTSACKLVQRTVHQS